ncbi:MAG TPA: hypothetical protein VF599_11370 [Pyrinomonadaceae bacterium]
MKYKENKAKGERQKAKARNKFSLFTFYLFSFALKISASVRLCGFIFLFAVSFSAQDLPGEIRGYKVHRAKVSVQTETGKNNLKEDFSVVVKFDKPELVKVSPLGATFEVSGEMTVFEQSGKIDFLAFKDFRVNGLKVEIEEYKESFEIEKNKPARLKKPFKIFVSTTQTIKGGLKEIFRSETQWQVTGRIFVFGKFKKIGFKFKRVVPVDVNLKIINPLQSEPEK